MLSHNRFEMSIRWNPGVLLWLLVREILDCFTSYSNTDRMSNKSFILKLDLKETACEATGWIQ